MVLGTLQQQSSQKFNLHMEQLTFERPKNFPNLYSQRSGAEATLSSFSRYKYPPMHDFSVFFFRRKKCWCVILSTIFGSKFLCTRCLLLAIFGSKFVSRNSQSCSAGKDITGGGGWRKCLSAGGRSRSSEKTSSLDSCVSVVARNDEGTGSIRRLCSVDGDVTRGKEEELDDGSIKFLSLESSSHETQASTVE